MPELKSKEWFALLIIVLFAVDIIILLDIPFLRPVFAFLYFTTIPGLLILYILNLNEIEFWKKFVLSVGLSVCFLIFAGLFINTLLPTFGFSKPLSTSSLLLSFNVILYTLCFIEYRRNKEEAFHLPKVSNIKPNKKDLFASPLLFAFLFPFFTIFGVNLMNTTGNNIILFVLPFLTVIYAAFITYFNKKIPKITYPIAILAIAISFILIIPLRAEYLILGGDGNLEYCIFRLTSTNMHWNMDYYHNVVNACLGGGLLHTIYFSLLGISREHIFQLVYPLIFSITPLCLFILSKKYIGELYAFLASLFFISQYSFIYMGIGSVRIAIGLFFFALAMMVFFDDEMNQLNKKILFLIFMFSLILSYYTYSYMFFFLILFSWLVLSVTDVIRATKFKRSITLTAVVLSMTVIFLWYSQITEAHFDSLVTFFSQSIESMADAFIVESRGEITEKTFARGLKGPAEITNLIVYYVTIILIGIGGIGLVRRRERSRFGIENTIMIIICLIFWLLAILIPHLTAASVGLLRIYFFTLILLAPMLLLGADIVRKITTSKEWIYNIKRRKSINSRLNLDRKNMKNGHLINYHWLTVLILLVVITSQFMVNTGITYQLFGDHRSVILNSDGLQYNIWYIHAQEITAGKWLIRNNEQMFKVHGDFYLGNHLSLINEEKMEICDKSFKFNKSISKGYIFLRYQNVVEGEILPFLVRKTKQDYVPLTNYSHLFVGKSRIYDTGSSEIYE